MVDLKFLMFKHQFIVFCFAQLPKKTIYTCSMCEQGQPPSTPKTLAVYIIVIQWLHLQLSIHFPQLPQKLLLLLKGQKFTKLYKKIETIVNINLLQCLSGIQFRIDGKQKEYQYFKSLKKVMTVRNEQTTTSLYIFKEIKSVHQILLISPLQWDSSFKKNFIHPPSPFP